MHKFLILFFLFANTAYAETSTDRVNLYFQDIKNKNYLAASEHFHSDDLKEFRDIMTFYKNIPKKRDQERFIKGFFGSEATIESVDKLTDAEFYSHMFSYFVKLGGDYQVDFDKNEVLGEVKEGDDTSHLLIRNSSDKGTTKINNLEVFSFKLDGAEWRMVIPESMTSAVKLLSFSYRRLENAQKRRVDNKAKLVSTEESDSLFNKIVDASFDSYNTGNWSTFAKLYDENSLKCLEDKVTEDKYASLSMFPISPDSTYEFLESSSSSNSNDVAIYSMTVKKPVSYKSRCDASGVSKRWLKKAFNVIEKDDKLKLTNGYSCLAKNIVNDEQSEKIKKNREKTAADLAKLNSASTYSTLISKKEYEKALSKLTKEDWSTVPEDIKRDRFPLKTIYKIQKKYNLNHEIASLVIHHICDVDNIVK